jgi:Na+/melibiose symporter-like transporter
VCQKLPSFRDIIKEEQVNGKEEVQQRTKIKASDYSATVQNVQFVFHVIVYLCKFVGR